MLYPTEPSKQVNLHTKSVRVSDGSKHLVHTV